MKLKTKLKNETNSKVYRRLRNELNSACPLCSPHKGCNKWKNPSRYDRSWKRFRKYQWKEVIK